MEATTLRVKPWPRARATGATRASAFSCGTQEIFDMSISKTIDIPAVIDANKVSGFQKWILILVGLTVVMDGFDVQAMGYVAPVIIKEWGVNKAMLGPVFGAGLWACWWVAGLERAGRQDRAPPGPDWASVFFAVFMILTAHATSIRSWRSCASSPAWVWAPSCPTRWRWPVNTVPSTGASR